MNGLIIKVLSICIAVVIAIYLIIYEKIQENEKNRNYSGKINYLRKKTICRYI